MPNVNINLNDFEHTTNNFAIYFPQSIFRVAQIMMKFNKTKHEKSIYDSAPNSANGNTDFFCGICTIFKLYQNLGWLLLHTVVIDQNLINLLNKLDTNISSNWIYAEFGRAIGINTFLMCCETDGHQTGYASQFNNGLASP